MRSEEVRFMWLLCLFDLPVGTKQQRGRAGRFRIFLKNDGYMMLQLSVYARICRGQEAVDKHIRRVKTALPSEGSVRILQVTDKQYARMSLLIGQAKKAEKTASNQLSLL